MPDLQDYTRARDEMKLESFGKHRGEASITGLAVRGKPADVGSSLDGDNSAIS
jgi:hypothetical protein